MGVIKSLRRRRIIRSIANRYPSPKREIMLVLLTAFTDERLFNLASDELTDDNLYLSDYISNLVEDNPVNVLEEVRWLTHTLHSLMDECNPQGTIAAEANYQRPEFILTYAATFLGYPNIKLSPEQKRALIAVTIRTYRDGDRSDDPSSKSAFHPDFKNGEWRRTTAGVITDLILSNANADVDQLAREYTDRDTRRVEIEHSLGIHDYYLRDAERICDYSESTIQRIREVKDSAHRQRWISLTYMLAYDKMTEDSLVDLLDVTDGISDNVRYEFLYHALKKIDSLPLVSEAKLSNSPEGHLLQRKALLHLTSAICNEGIQNSPVQDDTITDTRLIELVMQRPDKAEVIAEALIERKHYKYEELELLLDGPLGHGSL